MSLGGLVRLRRIEDSWGLRGLKRLGSFVDSWGLVGLVRCLRSGRGLIG